MNKKNIQTIDIKFDAKFKSGLRIGLLCKEKQKLQKHVEKRGKFLENRGKTSVTITFLKV